MSNPRPPQPPIDPRLTFDVGPGPCLYEWYAPRHDVPDSVNVRHVCTRGANHGGGWRIQDYHDNIHECVCGASSYG